MSVVPEPEITSGEPEKSKSPEATTASAGPVPSERDGPLSSTWSPVPPRTSPLGHDAVTLTSTCSSPSPFLTEVGVKTGALPHAVT